VPTLVLLAFTTTLLPGLVLPPSIVRVVPALPPLASDSEQLTTDAVRQIDISPYVVGAPAPLPKLDFAAEKHIKQPARAYVAALQPDKLIDTFTPLLLDPSPTRTNTQPARARADAQVYHTRPIHRVAQARRQ
jgi:hypothetical protein